MDMSRRSLLQAGLVAPVAPGLLASAPASAAEPVHRSLLWYGKPANMWTEALPVGNGHRGAMVFGGVKRERLQLNEDSLWSGGPYSNVNPRARAALPKVRDLIFAGRHAEAEELADADIQAVPMREMAYQALGDLHIDLLAVNETSAIDYRRELDLDTAIARTQFVADGVAYTREVFASSVDGVIVVAIGGGGAPIDAEFSLSSGQRARIEASGTDLIMRGRNNADRGIAGRLSFEARARVLVEGGEAAADGAKLRVTGARAILLLFAAATSHRSPSDVSGDPAARVRAALDTAASRPLADLHARHVAEHRRLFRRVALDLPRGKRAHQPTDQRLEHAADGDDPSLAALYFQFGRYLMLASSRPGSQPANLQGIWNEHNQPPWGSKYTININTQMNYWPVDSANLPECIEPLARMVEELAVSGARTARDMYGARGWVAHHNTDLWRASGPVDHARTGLWPTGGAWLACQLWDHWDYHRDRRWLDRIYPLLRGAAQFFLDTLVRDPATGFMVTNPSLSPENDHGHGSTLCAGPAMDMAILRDLFDRAGQAAELLDRDPALRGEMAAMRARLAPLRIGSRGQLQEWQADWDADAPDPHHRHVSHLYALYPSFQIDARGTPDLAAAARTSLDMRGDDATGWGLGWRLNLWARLRDGARAHRILIDLLSPGRTYPDMLDAHPPFQIDGNFGGAAGIAEMLVQGDGTSIDLLPALPPSWREGALRGVRVRGGCTVDLAWRDGQVEHVDLHPERPVDFEVRSPAGRARIRGTPGRSIRLDAGDFA